MSRSKMLKNLHALGENERLKNDNTEQNEKLLIAVKNRSLEDVATAIKNGANVNCFEQFEKEKMANVFRNSPLHICAENGEFEISKLLIDNCADIEQRNLFLFCKTPLANFNKHPLKFDKISVGSTPLHVAAACNKKEIVELLIKTEANLEAVNKIGNTALHCAAFSEASEVCRILLFASYKKASAFEVSLNSCGLTAYDLALSEEVICKTKT
ncbi:hypothetical protein MHBO_001703 [Bonamia ostreae]|uniref:Ankyrin repeat protein n=1 Tax=Bonamia ostreae TaxID=126728 RepID=A0ABV2AK09_9EUKA